MKSLLIEPSGDCQIIKNTTENIILKWLGKGHDQKLSKDASCHVYVHELWKVADLPINVFASNHAGMVIGGTSIIVPIKGTRGEQQLFSDDYKTTIRATNQDDDTVRRMQLFYDQNRKQTNFIWHEPDRWIYNGSYFDAIVIAEAEGHEIDRMPKYDIWFFSSPNDKPRLMRIVEFSLAEVMELMILGDLETSKGNPPEHFNAIL